MIPNEYTHFITWDYHSTNTNPIVFVSLSPDNECFVWKELNIHPKQNTTLIFAEKIAEASDNKKFKLCVIDPLAGENQTSTNTSVLEDVNRYLNMFKDQGICQKIRFEPYDTKYHATASGFLRGRDHIKQRMQNSEKVAVPFNNEVVIHGITKKIDTIWIFSECRQTLNSFYRWRIGGNGKPEQKWSHHCTALEGLFKDKRFKPRIEMTMDSLDLRKRRAQQQKLTGYFKSR